MATFKPNMNQDVQDIVKDLEKHEASEQPEAPQTKPEEWSKQMVRKGVLCPETGAYIHNSKQMHIRNFSPSGTFKSNYERTFGHG